MKIENFLDSTYLKTPEQSGLSEQETTNKVIELTLEAIENGFYAVMIRPNYVKMVRELISSKNSSVKLGTVIGFHEGTNSLEVKFSEAEMAIKNGADELDFVINYLEFQNGNLDMVEEELIKCTALCLNHNKIAKWIIEIAALTPNQISDICRFISSIISLNFKGKEDSVFIKSSTGFYITKDGEPNGATISGIKTILANAGKLPVKAAGGVKTKEQAIKMIELGVKRIGTSSALALTQDSNPNLDY